MIHYLVDTSMFDMVCDTLIALLMSLNALPIYICMVYQALNLPHLELMT